MAFVLSASAFAVPDINKADSVYLCDVCPLNGLLGYAEFPQNTPGTTDGIICLDDLYAVTNKTPAQQKACIKPLKKKFKSKKITKKKFAKLKAKKCPSSDASVEFFIEKRDAICSKSGEGLSFNLSPNNQLYPGQLCKQDYYTYDCSMNL